MPKADPVAIYEIAKRVRMHRDTVSRWKRLDSFPKPLWKVSNKDAWNWSQIEVWLNEHKPELLKELTR